MTRNLKPSGYTIKEIDPKDLTILKQLAHNEGLNQSEILMGGLRLLAKVLSENENFDQTKVRKLFIPFTEDEYKKIVTKLI